MSKYFLFFVLISQYVFPTESDSLIVQKPILFGNSLEDKFFEEKSNECDACGCSANGGSMGFASMINSNFVGIRYFNQSYKSTDGLYSNSAWYQENFNTLQVWARIPVTKKIQINALVPYQFHNRESESGNQNINGIGDITILGMHRLVKTKKDSTKVFSHFLQVGSGIKLPTGKFDEKNNGSFNPSYQAGTGSWDYLFATEYVFKYKKMGFNSILNYVLKTDNNKKYKFGNQFNYAGTFFYLYENKKYSLAPQIGFAGEIYAENQQLDQRVRNTAGEILFGKTGIEIGKNNFSFGTSLMLPLVQNLNGGNLESNYRWSVNLNYRL